MSDGRKTETISALMGAAVPQLPASERRLRGLLLASVALTSLLLVAPNNSQAAQNGNCEIADNGATANCAPNNNDFISYPSGDDFPGTVNVENGFSAPDDTNAVTLRYNGDIATINTSPTAQDAPIQASGSGSRSGEIVGVGGYNGNSGGSVLIYNDANVVVTNDEYTGSSTGPLIPIELSPLAVAPAGASGVGVRAQSSYGGATIVSTGDVDVSGADSYYTDGGAAIGLEASSFAGKNGTTGNANVTNTGAVTVIGGDGGIGVFGTGSGGEAIAIEARARAGNAQVQNSGDLNATGGYGQIIRYASDDPSNASGGNATGIYAVASGTVVVNHDAGTITATGGDLNIEARNLYGSGGLTAFGYAGGASGIIAEGDGVTINSLGDIKATGGNATGTATGGSETGKYAGATVSAGSATGINANGRNGTTTVFSSGDITATGGDVDLTATYGGSYQTRGTATGNAGNATGINVNGEEDAAAENEGTITVTGGSVTANPGTGSINGGPGGTAIGIAVDAYSDATITSSGDVTATGGDSNSDNGGDAIGMIASAYDGTATVVSEGTVVATGGSAAIGRTGGQAVGLVAFSKYGNASVTNSGEVSATGGTSGEKYGPAAGIVASAGGTATVDNSGAIEVASGAFSGKGGSFGRNTVLASGIFAVGQDDVTVGNSGTIDVSGIGIGIAAFSRTGTVSIDNKVSGDITITDLTVDGAEVPANGVGIVALSGGGIDIQNAGDITLTHDTSPSNDTQFGYGGIFAESGKYGRERGVERALAAEGGIEINNSGTISISVEDGTSRFRTPTFGILAISDGDITIGNSQTVTVVAGSNEGPLPEFALRAVAPEEEPAVAFGPAYGLAGLSFAGNGETSPDDEAANTSGGDISISTTGDVTLSAGPQDGNGFVSPQNVNAAIFAYSQGALNFGEENGADLDGTTMPTTPAGTTEVVVQGGAVVTANGDYVHGVFASGSENTISVVNGGSVTATGANAYGIVVNPQVARAYSRTEEPSEFGDRVTRTYGSAAASSTNTIRIGQGSSVTSTQSAAIVDNETFSFPGDRDTYYNDSPAIAVQAVDPGTFDPETGIVTVSVPNNTLVEVGGTVVGGDGRAIVLNGGDDTVVLEPGFDITGIVDGGTNAEEPGDGDVEASAVAPENDLLALGGDTGQGQIDFSLVQVPGQDQDGKQYINFESFQKQGNSTFTITGTNTGTFDLPVLDGTLLVNGNLANAALPVSDGATLGGTGTVGSLVANSGATIAPGTAAAPFGTLTTTGNATFQEGSTLAVNLNAAGQNNRLAVGGTTTIQGGTIAVNATPGTFTDQNYTVIDSVGAVSGKFDNVSDNLPDINFNQIVNPNSVVLGIVQEEPVGPDFRLSQKENGLASVFGASNASINFSESLAERARISNAPSGTGTPSAPLGYDNVASGQTAALQAVHNADLVSTEIAPITASPQIGFWLGTFGETTDVDDTSGALGYQSNSAGVAGGVEYRMAGAGYDAIVGIAAGYSNSDVDVEDGSADVDMGHVGIYGSYRNNALLLAGALSYGFNNTDLSRQIAFGGGQVTATADADGDAVSGYAEASYDLAPGFGLEGLSLAPLARLRGVHADRDGYDESGAGILNLSVEDDSVSQFFGGIGMRLGSQFTVGTAVLRPELELVYEHNFSDDSETSISTIPAANATFATSVFNGSDDRFSVGAALGMDFNTNFSAHLRYDGTFAGDVDSHRGAFGLTYKF